MANLSEGQHHVVVLRLDRLPAADGLAEFFMPPHYDLSAIMSAEDRRWLRVLIEERDAVRN